MARQVIPVPVKGGNLISALNSNFQQLFDSNPSLSDHDYEFIAEGNDGLNQDGNWRIRVTSDNRLVVERYDSSQSPEWQEITQFGASIEVDKIYLLAGLAAMGVVTSDNVYNIGRQAQNLDAIDLGDLEWPTILSSSEELRLLKSDGTTTENVQVQPLFDEDGASGTLLEFPLVGVAYTKIKQIKVLSLDASTDIRFVVRRNDSSGQVIMESKPEADFNIGINLTPVVAGENTFDIAAQSNPIYTSPSSTQWVQVFTKEVVRWQGHTSNIGGTDYFQPRILVDAVVAESNETLATREWVNSLLGNTIELTDFSIDINSRVDVGTDLNVQHSITYTVTGSSEITSLNLQVNGVNVSSVALPISDGTHTVNVTPSGIDTSSQTTLNFRLQANGMDNSNVDIVQVRNLQPHEFIYYGIGNIDPLTVDPNTLSSQEVISPGQFDVTLGPSVAGQDIVFLVPTDRDLTQIINKALNINIITSYTKVTNTRTIGSQTYNSYELDGLNADLTFNYTIIHN